MGDSHTEGVCAVCTQILRQRDGGKQEKAGRQAAFSCFLDVPGGHTL